MTTPTFITCEQFGEVLADVLERDADESTRSAAERHALTCAECGSLLADLRKLRIDAANLPDLTPSGDLWAGIEARIATPVVAIGAGDRTSRRRGTWVWGSAAAAALVIATAGITHVLTRRTYQPRSVASSGPATSNASQARQPSSSAANQVASSHDTIDSVAPSNNAPAVTPTSTLPLQPRARLVSRAKPSVQDTYDSEIARLRTVIRDRRSQLDPNTLAVIERNMAVIDDAIAQCKAALRRDPASRFLMQSLNSALDTKVELLRTAASLPARTL